MDTVRGAVDTINSHMSVWRFWGIHPKPTDGPWYLAYAIVAHAVTFTFVGCLLMSIKVAESVADVVAVIILAATFILIYIKAICLRWNWRRIHEMIALMHRLESDCKADPIERRFLREARVRSRRMLWLMSFFCYGGVTIFAVQPLWDGHALMYPSLYPFDWRTTRTRYYLTFFFQLICNYYVVIMFGSADSFGPAMYSFLAAYIDILSKRLENLGTSGATPAERLRQQRKCIIYHTQCLRLSRLIGEIFSVHYLFQISTSSLLVCSTAFQLSVISPTETPVAFMFLIEYMGAMVTEIFLPCYCGSLVKFRSAALPMAAYRSDWTGESKQFKSSLLILTERAKNPIQMMAYQKMFTIQLEVFVSVMRFAYSLLTFLKSFQ